MRAMGERVRYQRRQVNPGQKGSDPGRLIRSLIRQQPREPAEDEDEEAITQGAFVESYNADEMKSGDPDWIA